MKEYYKETIDWSKVKMFDPIEIIRDNGNHKILAYFISKDLDVVRFARSTVEDSEPTSVRHCRPLDKSCITRAVDWSKVPVDTKLIVDNGGEKLKRYFSHYKNSTVYTFDKGQTSWSCAGYMRVDWRIDQVEIFDDNVTEK
ncbi:MAG TPA: hypothetical protein VFM18_15590 [Methanosarcina sp.]|nr:hypothetical protein [Methanosarcina sp.]